MLDWINSLPLLPAIAFLMVVIYCRAGGTYLLGRLAYKLADRGRFHGILTSPRVESAAEKVNKWGAPIVALSFLTIGFQTAANLAAGVTRMPLTRYLPALIIGGFAWAVIYATVGLAAFALWWRVALTNPYVAVAIAVAAVGLLTYYILRKRAERNRATRELARERVVTGERAPLLPETEGGKAARDS
ncbi:MAG: VTT domain-containing protein [Dermabacter sp.]|nr:VTT domain-containing protein [Dermabacter sp.]